MPPPKLTSPYTPHFSFKGRPLTYMQGGAFVLSHSAANSLQQWTPGEWSACPNKVIHDIVDPITDGLMRASCFVQQTSDYAEDLCACLACLCPHTLRICALALPAYAHIRSHSAVKHLHGHVTYSTVHASSPLHLTTLCTLALFMSTAPFALCIGPALSPTSTQYTVTEPSALCTVHFALSTLHCLLCRYTGIAMHETGHRPMHHPCFVSSRAGN